METESTLFQIVEHLADIVGYVGVAFISLGSLRALIQYFRSLSGGKFTMRHVRVTLGTYILVGMEFMVGQDVIETVLYTDFAHLKELAMTVIIRTVLEFFLGKETTHLEHEIEHEGHGHEGHDSHGEAAEEDAGDGKGSGNPLLRNMRMTVVAAMIVGLAIIGASHILTDSGGEHEAAAESAEGEHEGLEVHGEEGEGEEGEGEKGEGEEGEGERGAGEEGEGEEGEGEEGEGDRRDRGERAERSRGEGEHREGREKEARAEAGEERERGGEDGESSEEAHEGREHGEESHHAAAAERERDEARHEGERGRRETEEAGFRAGRERGHSGPVHPENRVLATIESSANFLRRTTEKNGRIAPRMAFNGRPASSRHDVQVQAGAIYSLWREYSISFRDETKRTILRAAEHLKANHIRVLPDGRGLYISEAANRWDKPHKMRIENTTMGLIALIKAREIDEELVDVDVLRRLGEFVVLMQERDGGFRSHYHGQSIHRPKHPGQAILALTLLAQVDRNAKWEKAALRGIGHLVRSRKHDRDPWLLIAFAELYDRNYRDSDLPMPMRTIFAHMKTVARRMLAEVEKGHGEEVSCGEKPSLSADVIDGLSALQLVISPGERLHAELSESIHHGVEWFVKCQIRNGPARGGFVPNLRKKTKSVSTDNVLHALAALVGYVQMHNLVESASE